MIVYQVAKGRAITRSSVRLSQLPTPNIAWMDEAVPYSRPIQFNSPIASTFNQDTTSVFDITERDPHTMPQHADDRQ